MNTSRRGLVVLVLQLLLALAVTGKLAWDRVTLPRAWARTVPVDPDSPFRGRYVRLWLDAVDRRNTQTGDASAGVEFAVEDGQLVVHEARNWEGLPIRESPPSAARGVVVAEPVAFFIPEHADDPSRLEAGRELWVEVTVPRRELPRPIRVESRPIAPVSP
jgi:hypothetical protein